ncbi:MAG: fold metallo-hydrolase, partial [Hyphomicrobiales bacterium]|nr:fold metallo-hydrolase [Hyphomicrobiales bacterium]
DQCTVDIEENCFRHHASFVVDVPRQDVQGPQGFFPMGERSSSNSGRTGRFRQGRALVQKRTDLLEEDSPRRHTRLQAVTLFNILVQGSTVTVFRDGSSMKSRNFQRARFFSSHRQQSSGEAAMAQQIPIGPGADAFDAATDRARGDHLHEIAHDVAYQRLAIVNVVFIGEPQAGDRTWTLIDAGVYGSAAFIRNAARKRFGADSRPAAIVLTHGHFDHTGVLLDLAEEWDAPVYAHPLEHPFLNGTESYPAPDPSVGGGVMALLSPLYPRKPIDVGARLRVLPEDGSVPTMPGWTWVHTPGHTPGHVSFWRPADRLLVAGDAFITTAQESAYAVALQEPELHGPPAYFTPDWDSARESVRRLAALTPVTAVTGHGRAMHGPDFAASLTQLATRFDEVARPEGR